jgi:hypothetical protein
LGTEIVTSPHATNVKPQYVLALVMKSLVLRWSMGIKTSMACWTLDAMLLTPSAAAA